MSLTYTMLYISYMSVNLGGGRNQLHDFKNIFYYFIINIIIITLLLMLFNILLIYCTVLSSLHVLTYLNITATL